MIEGFKELRMRGSHEAVDYSISDSRCRSGLCLAPGGFEAIGLQSIISLICHFDLFPTMTALIYVQSPLVMQNALFTTNNTYYS